MNSFFEHNPQAFLLLNVVAALALIGWKWLGAFSRGDDDDECRSGRCGKRSGKHGRKGGHR